MTSGRRSRAGSMPVRVELADGARIQFEEPGAAGVQLDPEQIDELFEIGLMQPPRIVHRDPGVTLTGDARFLVGELDLGREVGLEVLVRGLEVAVDATLRQFRDRHPRPDAASDSADADEAQARNEAKRFHEDDAQLRVMTIDEAAERWAELLPRVELWDRIALTDDGRRVALIVAWDWWSLHRHRMASIESTYWAHWSTGQFNVGGWAWDIMRLLEPRDARVVYDTDATGDGDDDE